MQRPTDEMLHSLYMEQRVSPEQIAKMFGVHGRTVRGWMEEAGIPRLGPAHLRGGVSATWNVGLERTEEHRKKLGVAHLGKRPPNYGEGRIHFLCEVCDKEVWDKPYRLKRTCGLECWRKLMHVRGEDHWNYTGCSVQRRRLWKDYKEWRSAVLKAANYVCAACPATENLTAHHICSWTSHPDLRFDVANGICLCQKCHLDFHKETTFYDATPEQLMTWLATRCIRN